LTSTYWSAELPEAITFPESSFTEISESSFVINWEKPILDELEELPILSYRVFWDAGYLLEGNYILLEEVFAYD
jgi:hypothetical protein